MDNQISPAAWSHLPLLVEHCRYLCSWFLAGANCEERHSIPTDGLTDRQTDRLQFVYTDGCYEGGSRALRSQTDAGNRRLSARQIHGGRTVSRDLWRHPVERGSGPSRMRSTVLRRRGGEIRPGFVVAAVSRTGSATGTIVYSLARRAHAVHTNYPPAGQRAPAVFSLLFISFSYHRRQERSRFVCPSVSATDKKLTDEFLPNTLVEVARWCNE